MPPLYKKALIIGATSGIGASLAAKLHAAGVDEALFIWIAHDVAPRAMSPRIKGYVQPQSWFVDLRLPYVQ